MKRKKLRKDAMSGGAIKCDAVGCDYREEVVIKNFEYLDECIDYLKSYADKKCPKCGAILLTKKECSQAIAVYLILHNRIYITLEKILEFFGRNKTYCKLVVSSDKCVITEENPEDFEELTKAELERQDFVDNTIWDMVYSLVADDEYNGELVGQIRDAIIDYYKLPREFYPYLQRKK